VLVTSLILFRPHVTDSDQVDEAGKPHAGRGLTIACDATNGFVRTDARSIAMTVSSIVADCGCRLQMAKVPVSSVSISRLDQM
jgi:hypothetical protein